MAQLQQPHKKSEHEIQLEIIHYLEKRPNTIVSRRNSGVAYSITGNRMRLAEAGLPDLEVFLENGRKLDIEVKSVKGRLNDNQKLMFPKLEALGHTILIARCVEDVKAYFEQQQLPIS